MKRALFRLFVSLFTVAMVLNANPTGSGPVHLAWALGLASAILGGAVDVWLVEAARRPSNHEGPGA